MLKNRASERDAPEDLRRFCADVYPRVVGSMRLYTGDALLAEEIAQEAFFRLCRDWPDLSEHQNRVGWVHTVAYNLAKSKFRRRKAQRRAQRRAEDAAQASAAGEASMPDAAEVIAVREAVAALEADLRAVIVLRYYSGLSIAETADALGIPDGTVKTRTRRGIEALRGSGLMIGSDADLAAADTSHSHTASVAPSDIQLITIEAQS